MICQNFLKGIILTAYIPGHKDRQLKCLQDQVNYTYTNKVG